jgi:Ca2+-binding EF-hand superfamily protein
MQGTAEALRSRIWESLKEHFDRFKNKDGELASDDVDAFIVDVLHEETKNERDYVTKNLFRLDVDNSGAVSFVELGNFLFKSHCGEMSLQREHKAGRISNGADRKMTLPEFIHLINLAYDFLKVGIAPDVAEQIFNDVDKDKDGLITYGEYFQIIQKYICLPKTGQQPLPPKPTNEGQGTGQDSKEDKTGKEKEAQKKSKLRRHIWSRLRRLYDGYAQGRSLLANDAELRSLLLAITGDLSENEISIIGNGLAELNWKNIEFEPFAEKFIYLIAEVGLSRFAANRPPSKRTLNCSEFIILLKNTFSFLKLDNFKDSIL